MPAVTGSGASVFVTDRSALAGATVTVVVAVAVLFAALGSVVAAVTIAVFVMIVAFGVAASTFSTSVNESLAPAATVGFVQVMAPVPPTAGVVQAYPAGEASDTNV